MKLKAEKRSIKGKKVKQLRNEGKIPAAIYGPKRDSLDIVIDPQEAKKAFRKVGYNQIFDLEISGEKPVKVLFKEIQMNILTDEYIHASLYEMDMNKRIVVEIPVVVEGQSKAVKSGIGFLVTPIESLAVVCLPSDIPESLVIDISSLKDINDSISVSEISLPENVEWEASISEESVLARIVPPQKVVVDEAEEGEEESDDEDGEGGSEEGDSEPAEEKKED